MNKILGIGLAMALAFFIGTRFVSTPENANNISSVSAAEFSREIDQKDAIILDIRTPEEFSAGRIADSVNIDYYEPDFRDKLAKLDRDASYKIYCNSGNRSGETLKMMQEMGFTDVTELAGGIQAWSRSGLSTCTNC